MMKKSSTVDAMSVVVAIVLGIIGGILAITAVVGAFKFLLFVVKL